MTKRKTASGQAERHRSPLVGGPCLNLLGMREAGRDSRFFRRNPSLPQAREALRHHTYFSDRAGHVRGRAGDTIYIE